MGKKDLYQSEFYDDPRRFSDAFNGILFAGREVMKPEELEETDSVLVGLPESNSGRKVICDKIRRWKGRYVSLMVLENQSYVDYRMVLRAMKTEVMGYEKQQREALAEAKVKGSEWNSHEYLSRMKKEQKFVPIITLVLYMGTDKPWDGARSLYELLEIEERLKPFVNDYKLNLYDYHEHQDFSVFKTENRILFEALSCAGDEGLMEEMLRSHPEWYERLDRESAKAILGIMGVRIDIDKIREIKEKEEVYNVCKAFDDHLERGRREGRREGKREGMQEALKNLMENLQVSLEQAMELLGIPLEDRDKYFPLV